MATRSPAAWLACAPCWACAATLLLVSCRTAAPVAHPQDVEALLAESSEPYDARFSPLGAAELAGMAPPAPAPYRLGVGDVVQVLVPELTEFAALQASTTGAAVGVRVQEDGQIYVPILRGVPAAGRTVLDVREEIRARLDASAKKDVFVNVDVIEHRSQRYFVFGQVVQPGAYPVDGRATIRDGLARAGGPLRETGDMDEAYAVRQGQVLPIPFAAALFGGHPSGSIPLEDGDVLFVPHRQERSDLVYVLGEVQAPGVVEMRHQPGDAGRTGGGRLTLAEAIARAGGFDAENADYDTIRIFRGGACDVRAFTIAAHEVYRHGDRILLHPGDRVLVAPSESATYARAMQGVFPLLQGVSAVGGLGLAASALSR